MSVRNLLDETIGILKVHNLTPDDVVCVVDREFNIKVNWKTFVNEAKDFNYDPGYGLEEVNVNLCIIGEDWWLEREQYDGSEWWEFKKKPDIDSFVLGKLMIRNNYY